ncbi:MAG: hypothetical protein KC549_10260, partial [Myxococcales bacterium]|nr:hypothetical protein [Myxococcales bacterium]
GEHLARPAAEWAGIAERSLSAGDEAIAAFPLARIEPGKPLPLADGVNPAWAGKVAAFRQAVVAPLLGDRALLTADQWEDLKRRFAGHEAWLAAKKGAAVEGLGLPRVRALLAGEERAAIAALIAEDEARRPEAEALASVDKAALLYRDFYTFLNNFVSFADFYERGRPAVFQAGTLYLDGRTCDLCLSVADVGKHSAVAGLSHAYLAYCDCTRKGSAEKRTIAVAFTGGDVDFLRVGRNGLFYDRDGVDWDATIVKVVEAPLSIRQAFWSPYKRIGRLFTEQIEKFAAAREKQVQASSTAQVTGAAGKVETAGAAPKPDAPKPAAPSFDIAKFAGIFAAIGLAIGAIGAFAAALVTGFLSLKLWQMPLALAGVALLISAPSMLLAWLKLRQRNLAPLLDASGWAINTRARITVPFGATLTQLAALPDGASRTTGDPYAEPTPAWKRWAVLAGVAVVASILWEMGLLRRWLGL